MDALQALNEAPLKAVFLGHFMLICWCLIGNWLPASYMFYNTFFMLCLLWSMHSRDSHDPILIATLINLLSIILDAITIGVYYDDAHNRPCMAITNLMLRPITSLVLLRIYNERNGRYSTFGFPGLGGLNPSGGPAGGGGNTGRGSYENIDGSAPRQSVPSPIHDVEANHPPYK
ncbi:unnamed protein product [Oppiella nova]|uniref:Type-1 angiotensin II receptor-associated protein n=1 Tax=Oppiella nova TaxID=334625 RepID=A0A7R9QQN8_9ACAR|nr:unnamed protein product [Oppiella nova]CAG2170292.1 unnamed protein product [Oppiella nova]